MVMVRVSLGSCEILSGVENIKMVSLFSFHKNNIIRTSRLKFQVFPKITKISKCEHGLDQDKHFKAMIWGRGENLRKYELKLRTSESFFTGSYEKRCYLEIVMTNIGKGFPA